MDTKSKNTRQDKGIILIESKNFFKNSGVKIIAFLLAVVLMTAGVFTITNTAAVKLKHYNISDTWGQEDYLKSNALYSEVNSVYQNLYEMTSKYRSEEYIRSGAMSNTSDTIESYKLSLLAMDKERYGLWETLNTDDSYYNKGSDSGSTPSQNVIDIINSETFMARHGNAIEQFKQDNIRKNLQSYANIRNSLDNAEKTYGIKWYTERDGEKHTSKEGVNPDELKKQKVYLENNKGVFESSIDLSYVYTTGNVDSRILLSFDDKKVEEMAAVYKQDQALAFTAVQIFFICGLLSFICLIFACIGAGRQEDSDIIYLRAIDKVYWDLNLLIVGSLEWVVGLLTAASIIYNLPAYISVILLAIGIGITYAYILSLVRVIKAHQVRDRFGTLVLCKKIWHLMKKIGSKLGVFYTSNIKGRSIVMLACVAVVASAIIGILIIFALPFGLLLFGVAIGVVIRHTQSLDQTIKGVKRVYDGETEYQIEVKGAGPIEEMASQINHINEGLSKAVKEAVEKELKSERLKTELITNVSHDIRTPLTSIITYIDLLKTEDIDDESRERYISVLEQKAARLKALTDDLFEAAKASTGNIEVHWDTVNLAALLNQGMGEMEDKIEASSLNFIVNRPQDKVLVKGDGRLIWRIIENLLSNTVKYALNNSRVYITIDRDLFGKRGVFVIKNISQEQLNIPAQELLGRFKRGDDTRHSEGSGLGLAIAKDLTELQNGQFDLEIDGDLFKATVYFQLEDGQENAAEKIETE